NFYGKRNELLFYLPHFFAYILFPFSFKTNLFLVKLRNFYSTQFIFDGTVKLFTRNNLFLMKL
ncbi:MAG: hypothetical protein D8B52_01945, partial [Prevotella sp.]